MTLSCTHLSLPPSLLPQLFFKVFLTTFLSNPHTPGDLPNTPQFRSCLNNSIFMQLYDRRVRFNLRMFEQAWNNHLRYFRAIKGLDLVLQGVLNRSQNLDEQCQTAVLKMTGCPRCAGYSNDACQGLCLNTMRGCLLDRHDFVEPLEMFGQALVAMKNLTYSLDLNPYSQFNLLQSRVLSFVYNNQEDFSTILSMVSWEGKDVTVAHACACFSGQHACHCGVCVPGVLQTVFAGR